MLTPLGPDQQRTLLAQLAAAASGHLADRPDFHDGAAMEAWLGDIPTTVGGSDVPRKLTLVEKLIAIAAGDLSGDSDEVAAQVVDASAHAIAQAQRVMTARAGARIEMDENETLDLDDLASVGEWLLHSSDDRDVAAGAGEAAGIGIAELYAPTVMLADIQAAHRCVAAAVAFATACLVPPIDTPGQRLYSLVACAHSLAIDQPVHYIGGSGDLRQAAWARIVRLATDLVAWAVTALPEAQRGRDEITDRAAAAAANALADSAVLNKPSAFDHADAADHVRIVALELATRWLDRALGLDDDAPDDNACAVADLADLQRIIAQSLVGIAAAGACVDLDKDAAT